MHCWLTTSTWRTITIKGQKNLSDSIKTSKHINKVLLISVIEQFVLRNSELFMQLGIMMHLIIIMCSVDENLELSCQMDGWLGQLFLLDKWVIDEYNHLLLPHVSWKYNYLNKRKVECSHQGQHQFIS